MVLTKKAFKWIKGLTLVLAIIPILIFLAFTAAITLIDFNQYKPQIEQEVAELTNRKVKIEGAVDFSVMPFTFHVGQFSLENPEGFGDGKFLTVKEANIELSFKKLFLDNQFDVSALEIIEPKIHFIEQENKNNWDDMPLFSALNKRVNAVIPVASNAFNRAGFIKVNSPASSSPSEITIPDMAPAEIAPKWFLESLVVKDAVITYENQQQDFSVTLKRANVITFDVRAGEPFKVNSDFIYEHSQSERSFDFQLNTEIRLSDDFTQLHMQDWNGVFRLQVAKERNLPDIRMGTTGENLMVDIKHQQIYVKDALLKGMNSEVLTSFQGEFGANPQFQGVFSAQQINLREWLKHLGLPAPKMQKEKALTNIGGKFLFNWDGETLKLDDVKAQVDDANIEGNISLLDSNEGYKIVAKLAVDNLNSDNYLAVTEQGQSYFPVATSWLANMNLQTELSLTAFTVLGTQAPQVSMNIEAQAGQFVVAPFDIKFNRGSLLSKAEINLSPTDTAFYWKGKTVDLALSELSTELALTGLLNSRFTMQTQGSDMQQWLANLMGNVQADMQPAQIAGVDFNEVLSGQLRLDKKARVTELQNISLLGKIHQGQFVPKRLTLKGEQFVAAGVGYFDLSQQKLEGELRVNINNAAENLASLQGQVLPIQFAGNFRKLDWQLGELEN